MYETSLPVAKPAVKGPMYWRMAGLRHIHPMDQLSHCKYGALRWLVHFGPKWTSWWTKLDQKPLRLDQNGPRGCKALKLLKEKMATGFQP